MNGQLPSDESLFATYRKGDMDAFEQLYARYRQPLYLYLLRLGHSQATAEDIFHDSWIRVIDSHYQFDGVNFKAWLYTVARNLSTDTFRKAQIRQVDSSQNVETILSTVSVERQQEGEDCVELIKTSVAALPIEQRDVFLLKEEAGLSLQQIADIMAVGRETIKSRVRYAMQQLKLMMEECL
jgi:RNA polymerase sigma-70 factor (ECF subfamily)